MRQFLIAQFGLRPKIFQILIFQRDHILWVNNPGSQRKFLPVWDLLRRRFENALACFFGLRATPDTSFAIAGSIGTAHQGYQLPNVILHHFSLTAHLFGNRGIYLGAGRILLDDLIYLYYRLIDLFNAMGFLRHIDAPVPDNMDVHIIMDNYSIHKHQKVRSWFARRPRYYVHYSPTYSSWLNQVDTWFGIITRKAIRRGSFRNTRQLADKIKQFVEAHNQNSKPFIWAPTAASIFTKLECLCQITSVTER